MLLLMLESKFQQHKILPADYISKNREVAMALLLQRISPAQCLMHGPAFDQVSGSTVTDVKQLFLSSEQGRCGRRRSHGVRLRS